MVNFNQGPQQPIKLTEKIDWDKITESANYK